MNKTKRGGWCWLVLAAVLMATTAVAQIDMYGLIGAGSFMQAGQKSCFAYWIGGEAQTAKFIDTARGLAVVARIGGFTADRHGGEIQGASTWLITKKELGIWNRKSLYVGLGGGMLYEILEGDDQTQAGLKLEFGLVFTGKLGMAIGCDMVPIRNDYDQFFPYIQIDLTPKL